MKEKLGLRKNKNLTEDGTVEKVTKKLVKRRKRVDVSSLEVPSNQQLAENTTNEDTQIPTINRKKTLAKKKKVTNQIAQAEAPSFDSDIDESEFCGETSRKLVEDIDDEEGQHVEMESDNEETRDNDDQTLDNTEEDIGDEQTSDEEDEESGDEEIKDLRKFRESMANLPLSEVREMKEKLGIKLFNKAYFGTAESDKKKEKEADEEKKVIKKRVNQHRPLEVSSKKKVSVFRDIYTEEKKEKQGWDPRFDERVGEYKEGCFDSNYAFLDEMRNDEREQLKNELSECLNSGDDNKAERLAKLLKRMEDQEKSRKEKQLVKSAMHEIREENIERMMQGQRPVFKTKAQVRGKIMEKKFEQLKQEHKLDSYMKRKAKQEAHKAKKSRPDVVNFEQRYGYQS